MAHYVGHNKSRLTFGWGVAHAWLSPHQTSSGLSGHSCHQPPPLCRMCSCSASEGGGRRREDQLCWCSVYLDSWHFSPCLHFKAIHHAQGITSRPWIAELAPWDVFSCENWLGRTALLYEKNALTFLFLKGGVNRRGWVELQACLEDVCFPCALVDGRWRERRIQCHAELQSPSDLCASMTEWISEKEMRALRSELHILGLRLCCSGVLWCSWMRSLGWADSGHNGPPNS